VAAGRMSIRVVVGYSLLVAVVAHVVRGACPSPEDIVSNLAQMAVSGKLKGCDRIGLIGAEISQECASELTLNCFLEVAQERRNDIMDAKDTCLSGLCQVQGFINMLDEFSSCDGSLRNETTVILDEFCKVVPKTQCAEARKAVANACDHFGAACDLQVSTLFTFMDLNCYPDMPAQTVLEAPCGLHLGVEPLLEMASTNCTVSGNLPQSLTGLEGEHCSTTALCQDESHPEYVRMLKSCGQQSISELDLGLAVDTLCLGEYTQGLCSMPLTIAGELVSSNCAMDDSILTSCPGLNSSFELLAEKIELCPALFDVVSDIDTFCLENATSADCYVLNAASHVEEIQSAWSLCAPTLCEEAEIREFVEEAQTCSDPLYSLFDTSCSSVLCQQNLASVLALLQVECPNMDVYSEAPSTSVVVDSMTKAPSTSVVNDSMTESPTPVPSTLPSGRPTESPESTLPSGRPTGSPEETRPSSKARRLHFSVPFGILLLAFSSSFVTH